MTMLLVTHEMTFARRVGDMTIFMNQGRIWESGESESIFRQPQTARVPTVPQQRAEVKV